MANVMINPVALKDYVETVQRNAILERLYEKRRNACYQKDIENGVDPTFIFRDDEDED